jgi:hypothetical protein
MVSVAPAAVMTEASCRSRMATSIQTRLSKPLDHFQPGTCKSCKDSEIISLIKSTYMNNKKYETKKVLNDVAEY